MIFMLIVMIGYSRAGESKEGEQVCWETVSAGAQTSHAGGYFLSGTVGQVAVGVVNSPNHGTIQGFHQDFGAFFVCDCVPGNVNEDSYINVLDILDLIDYKFREGPPPLPYDVCSGDVNRDCYVNVIDIMLLIDYKFKEGEPPCECPDWVTSCGPPIIK